MAGIGQHSRYWNDALVPLYNRVAVTPENGAYTCIEHPTNSQPSCSIRILAPLAPLIDDPLRADAFETLLRPNETDLLPPRPCFAKFPTSGRSAGATSRRKEKLPEGSFFRAVRIRLKPTPEQAIVLRQWMACAQAHYNAAVDIINTTWDGVDKEAYVKMLHEHDPSLSDGECGEFWNYQLAHADRICSVTERLVFKTSKRKRDDEEDDGLRSVVHELLSAEPDFEKMAPSARASYKDMRWTQDAPRHVLDAAVNEALDALSHGLAQKKHRFGGLRFRSLRNLSRTPTQSIHLEATKRTLEDKRISGQISKFTRPSDTLRTGKRRADVLVHLATSTGAMKGLGPIRGTDSKCTVDWLIEVGCTLHASEVLWDKRTRKFFLIVKRVVQRQPDTKPLSECSVVGFDPGVRCFQAFSCPDGRHGELLAGGKQQLSLRDKQIERLQSVADQMKNAQRDFCSGQTRASIRRDTSGRHRRKAHQRRRNVEARARRKRVRKHEWTRNMHYEAIKTTFQLGDLVIAPVLESERICARATRIFGAGTAKSTYEWSHYSFLQRLWHKSQVTTNARVAFTCEPGTTKTCDACGCVCSNLGGATVFRCKGCGHIAGRDVGHASRGNILAAIGAANNTPWDGIVREHVRTTGHDLAAADGISPL